MTLFKSAGDGIHAVCFPTPRAYRCDVSKSEGASKIVLLAIFGLAACEAPRLREGGANHPAPSGVTTNPQPAPERTRTLVEATSPDGALWALRLMTSRGRTGPMTIMRMRDLSVVATLSVGGEASGGTTGAGDHYEGARFCDDRRFALLTRASEQYSATLWDLESGTSRPIPISDHRYRPLAWSGTCELISVGPSEKGTKDVADAPEGMRVPISLIGLNTTQNFEVVALEGENADVVDVTDDALLVSTWRNGEHMRATSSRLLLIDRKSGRTTTLSTTPSTWVRQTTRSWVVIPASGKAPRVQRLGAVNTSSASSVGSVPNALPLPSGGEVAAALDANRETLAVFDEERMQWWSLPSSRRLGTQPLERFHIPYPGKFDLSFSSDGRLLVANDEYGNVIAVRREGGVAYRYAFGIHTCGRPGDCALGNMEEVMRSVTSADRTRFAVGTDWDASKPWLLHLEVEAKRTFETTVIDLATGKLHVLPTRGVPVGFVGDNENLVIGDDVWSIADGRVVGHLPH